MKGHPGYSKYTLDDINVKLQTPLYIQSFTLNLNMRKTGRFPRVVRINVSLVELKDATELLDERKTGWRHVRDFRMGTVKLVVVCGVFGVPPWVSGGAERCLSEQS